LRTVEIFSSTIEHLVNDSRVQKYGFILGSQGVKSFAKVNPVAIWVDAGLSVIDAVNSYLNYKKECEITKQIKLVNERLNIEIDNKLLRLKMENTLMEQESKVRIDLLTLQLKKNSAGNDFLLKSINNNLEHIKRVYLLVKKERENNVDVIAIQTLQTALDHLIKTSLMYLLYSIDNSGKEIE